MFEVSGPIFNCSTVLARCAILFLFASLNTAWGQFAPALLQNASYWGDGKSEIDFYNAEFAPDGPRYPVELLMVFTPAWVDPALFAQLDDPKQPGALPVIRMNALTTIPHGLLLEQHSLNILWRMDFMSLARISFTGADSVGTMAKTIQEKRETNTVKWKYACDTYRGKVDGQEIGAPDGTAVFYDELPFRVRMIDFAKTSGDFDIQLAPALLGPACESIIFKPARVSFKVGKRAIDVEVKHGGGTDHFVLDHEFPFLLREWRAADGSQLKMKNSIKADYQTYNKPGDRERALKDPMLRHPD
jgi:hypothetical protein